MQVRAVAAVGEAVNRVAIPPQDVTHQMKGATPTPAGASTSCMLQRAPSDKAPGDLHHAARRWRTGLRGPRGATGDTMLDDQPGCAFLSLGVNPSMPACVMARDADLSATVTARPILGGSTATVATREQGALACRRAIVW